MSKRVMSNDVKTSDINIVEIRQQRLSFLLPNDIIQKRSEKLLDNIIQENS